MIAAIYGWLMPSMVILAWLLRPDCLRLPRRIRQPTRRLIDRVVPQPGDRA